MGASKPQNMLNRFDLIHPPQFCIEGYGPSNYGDSKKLGDGNDRTTSGNQFTAPFQVGDMSISNNPSFEDRLFAGELDREGVIKVWEANTITLSGLVLNNPTGFDLLQWAVAKPRNLRTAPSSGVTPDQSRTWLYSGKDAKGRLCYVIARGCKVQSANVNVQNKSTIRLELTCNVQSIYVKIVPFANTQTANPEHTSFDGSLGNGLSTNDTDDLFESYYGKRQYNIDGTKITLIKKESVEQPMKFQDVGAFYYKPIGAWNGATNLKLEPDKMYENSDVSLVQNLAYESLTLGVDYGHRMQDSNGHDRTLYLDFASRTGTGTIGIYKQGYELNEDARTDELHTAWMELQNDMDNDDVHAAIGLDSRTLTAGNSQCKSAIVSKVPGKLGHEIRVAIKLQGNKNEITVNGKDISLTIPSTGKVSHVRALIEGNINASRLVTVQTRGTTDPDEATITVVQTTSNGLIALSGGKDYNPKLIFENFKFQPSHEALINQSEATIESKGIQADRITYAKIDTS